MAIFGKNTRVDTPFDDYKKRSEAPGGIQVGRSKAAPLYLNNKSVIFLVGVILSLAMKCESVLECVAWAGVIFVMILFWSVTVRFFVPHKNMTANMIINYIYVVLFGLAYSYLLKYVDSKIPLDAFRLNLESIYDMHYLTPMALAFSAVSRYDYDRPEFGWNILLPTGLGFFVMLITSLTLGLLHITKGFVAIMEASLLLMLISVILSLFYKHGVYFSAPPQYNIFTAVPNRDVTELGKFVINKIVLFGVSLVSITVCILLNRFVGSRFPIRFFDPLIMALLLGGFLAIVNLIPYLTRRVGVRNDIRDFIRFYEYPAISTFLSLPLAGEYPYFKLLVYIVLLTAADALITGLVVAIPRRLIFSNRNSSTTGAPAILLIISLIVMVGTIFFVIY